MMAAKWEVEIKTKNQYYNFIVSLIILVHK